MRAARPGDRDEGRSSGRRAAAGRGAGRRRAQVEAEPDGGLCALRPTPAPQRLCPRPRVGLSLAWAGPRVHLGRNVTNIPPKGKAGKREPPEGESRGRVTRCPAPRKRWGARDQDPQPPRFSSEVLGAGTGQKRDDSKQSEARAALRLTQLPPWAGSWPRPPPRAAGPRPARSAPVLAPQAPRRSASGWTSRVTSI